MRSPAVKRLMREAQELSQPTEEFSAQPLEDNLFEWHFTVRGPPDSDFDGGIYHGRIVLPADYPMKPPSIILLTPNGRFETNKKICLSISGHHPESWQPSWSIRTALLAIIGFMPTSGKGAIGALDYTTKERKVLARKSQDWKCDVCGYPKDLLLKRTDINSAANQEARELANQISFKGEENVISDGNSDSKVVKKDSVPVESSSQDTSETGSRPKSMNGSAPVESSVGGDLPLNRENYELASGIPANQKDAPQNPTSASEAILRQRLNAAASSTSSTLVTQPLPTTGGRSSSTTVTMCVLIVLIVGLLLRRLFFL